MMANMIPRDTDIMSWDPENMETYWQQSRLYDTRSNDTCPVMGSGLNQKDSQLAFTKMLKRFSKKRNNKFVE